ncbi:MAG: hypothetical protein RL296_464, partial [Actinomycetota bacterium]
VLAQSTSKRCSRSALHRKHRATDFHCAFVIENAERRRRVPVSNTLMLSKCCWQIIRSCNGWVLRIIRTRHNIRMGNIRQAQQHVFELRGHLIGLCCERLLFLAKRPALSLRRSVPTCFDNSFTCWRIASRSAVISRILPSKPRASSSKPINSGLLRRAISSRTVSGSLRR